MEEEYKNQLKAAEEGRIQSLEELRQVCESRLEEKSQHLAEVDPEETFAATTLKDPFLSFPMVCSVRRSPSATDAGSTRP